MSIIQNESGNANVPEVVPPTKINVDRTWHRFYGGALTYKFDVWVDSNETDCLAQVSNIFTERFSDEELRNQLECMHYHALHSDLSDQWLRATSLGLKLWEENFRILAFIERPCAFDFMSLTPTLKCSLLIGRVSNPVSP